MAVINDYEHFFCTCPNLVSPWMHLKNIVANLMQFDDDIQNFDLVSLRFSKRAFETEITWIIASYVNEVWKLIHKSKVQHINRDKLFGFLKYKYKKDQLGSRMQLQLIPGL